MDLLLNELFYSEDKLDLAQEDDLIWKTILRTGSWALTPRLDGQVESKPLVVKRDGPSDVKNNIISMSEIQKSFDEGAFEYVTVPLATAPGADHADIARNNTGFVRKLKIEQTEDGSAKLLAAFDFTEPEIKERVQRGTIPNTSVGLLYNFIRKSDAKEFPIALAHVALTHRPWIDGMEPFGVAASDQQPDEIKSFQLSDESEEVGDKSVDVWKDREGLNFLKEKISSTLLGDLGLGEEFEVSDIAPGKVKIVNKSANLEWATTFVLNENDEAKLPPIQEWILEGIVKPSAEEVDNPETVEEIPELVPVTSDFSIDLPSNDLSQAQLLRERRFAQNPNTEVINMSDKNTLNGLNLADLPDDARTAIEALQNRNAELEKDQREAAVETLIGEYQEMGLSEYPGFLKEVRRALKSDDGSVAGILLADDDHPSQEKVTLSQVIDRLVKALPKNDEGKIELSQQIEVTADHRRPPVTTDDDTPFEDRKKAAMEELGIKRGE